MKKTLRAVGLLLVLVMLASMLAGCTNKTEVVISVPGDQIGTELASIPVTVTVNGKAYGVEIKGDGKAVVNGKEIPIFISDYVLATYGTGAIMAVPAHDERDYDFAKVFGLPIIEVVLGGEDNDPNLKMIDTLVDNIKTQGRTSLVKGTLMLDFSISGMEFELDCAGDVYATVNTRKLSSSSADGGLYFTIIVDGQKLARDYCHISSVGETKVLLAEDLPAGKHTFAIYRQSEHSNG